jgi:hypothetical protein
MARLLRGSHELFDTLAHFDSRSRSVIHAQLLGRGFADEVRRYFGATDGGEKPSGTTTGRR